MSSQILIYTYWVDVEADKYTSIYIAADKRILDSQIAIQASDLQISMILFSLYYTLLCPAYRRVI